MRFRSDSNTTNIGFSIRYESKVPLNETCGQNLKGTSGVIESPNYPLDYPDNCDCEWTVEASGWRTIFFELLAFDLEKCCSCDYVEIR